MADEQPGRFDNLGFDDFRKLAQDESLSPHEKVGFPDSYREGKGQAIFADILDKVGRLRDQGRTVVDVGAGCGELAMLMIDHCRTHNHGLVLIDSPEVLDQLPDEPFLTKVGGRFPGETRDALAALVGKTDAVVCYDVLQVVFAEGNSVDFFDRALELLAPGGQLLFGDIPNVSKRKRFFASGTGIQFHKEFMQTEDAPDVEFNAVEPQQMDDAVLLGLVMRARAAGFDAYWMPQPAELPMANRREDLLVIRP
ncbi:MAG: class I SAM-dependent methyltransferase [bacterium]|nr:class I SAM-dependent methyltransferase [bacterium]